MKTAKRLAILLLVLITLIFNAACGDSGASRSEDQRSGIYALSVYVYIRKEEKG